MLQVGNCRARRSHTIATTVSEPPRRCVIAGVGAVVRVVVVLSWCHRGLAAPRAPRRRTRPGRGSQPASRSRLTACAHIAYEIARQHHGAELTALLHREEHVAHSEQQLHNLIRDVLTDAAKAGSIRNDYPPDELATYCRHALNAAGSLPSQTAVQRLITLTLAALQPPQQT
jgi:hypothetical protein